MNFKVNKAHRTFDGHTCLAEHDSEITKTKMKFSYFMPNSRKPDHAILWLSGLTCTEENFITKAGAQKYLSEKNALILCPDTSPRGLDLPGEHDSYDFGSGAGFYLNALTDGYKDHYRMYDYILQEILPIIKKLEAPTVSIMGHSMGGHGALVLGLREASLFTKVSAFSPIVNPIASPWGQKAFKGYLGDDNWEEWKKYDACEIVRTGTTRDKILIDQGLADEFYPDQLMTSHFEEACKQAGQPLQLNYREDFDHSFYFISSFIEKHLAFHLQ